MTRKRSGSIARLGGWGMAVLMLMIPVLCLAGKPTYPKSVQADADGNWSATIIVTNTTNPDFKNSPPVNSTLSSVETIHQTDGSFRIELRGQLIDPTKNGSITFTVDPIGVIVRGAINILRP